MDIKQALLNVLADDEINRMKDYLGIRMPDEEAGIVKEVLDLVVADVQRALDNYGSEVTVTQVDNYLKRNGYDCGTFWHELPSCFMYEGNTFSYDKAKFGAILARYTPTVEEEPEDE